MKKMKVLALVMVFAFAALGGAYAMWYDDLVVDETVSTGYLDLEWNTLQVPDPSPNYEGYDGDVYGVTEGNEGLDELDPGNPNNAKNVGYLDAEIVDDGGSDIDSDLDQLNITLGNGYPGYQDRVFATIENLGTVPAKFDINALDIPDWLIVEIWFDADPTRSKDDGEDFMVWSNADGYDSKLDLQGYQIDPGETIPVAVYTRVLQAAPQDTDIDFTITLQAQQWNEFGLPDSGIYENPNGDQGILPSEIITQDRKDPLYDSDNGTNNDEGKYSDYNNTTNTI